MGINKPRHFTIKWCLYHLTSVLHASHLLVWALSMDMLVLLISLCPSPFLIRIRNKQKNNPHLTCSSTRLVSSDRRRRRSKRLMRLRALLSTFLSSVCKTYQSQVPLHALLHLIYNIHKHRSGWSNLERNQFQIPDQILELDTNESISICFD